MLLTATCLILATAVTISSVEDLLIPKRLFRRNLLDWRYCLAFQPYRPPLGAKAYEAVFGRTAVRAVSIARAVAVVSALVTLHLPSVPSLALLVAIVCHSYLCYRLPYSLDGADQMILMNLVGALVMSGDRGDGCMMALGAAFVTAQAAIAYLTAGLAKLASASWRSGAALSGIMTTAMFGSDSLDRLISRWKHGPRIVSAAAYSGLIFTGTAILLGDSFAVAAVALSLTFHVGVALLMDLNLFVWAFGASIPSILFMGRWENRFALVECLF